MSCSSSFFLSLSLLPSSLLPSLSFSSYCSLPLSLSPSFRERCEVSAPRYWLRRKMQKYVIRFHIISTSHVDFQIECASTEICFPRGKYRPTPTATFRAGNIFWPIELFVTVPARRAHTSSARSRNTSSFVALPTRVSDYREVYRGISRGISKE